MALMQSRTRYPLPHRTVLKQEPYVKVPRFMLDRMEDLTGAEVKVLLYMLRRTAGYGEDGPKVITCAEFQGGRKRADGTILEGGTGLSRAAILTTVKGLVAKGLLYQEPVGLAPGYYVNRYTVYAPEGGETPGAVHPEGSRTMRQERRTAPDQAGQRAALSSQRITLESFRQRLEQRRPFLQGAPVVRYGWQGWKALREFMFRVDNFTCQYCRRAGGFLVVDHILPRSRGGGDEPTNLVTACLACNSSKGTKTPEEWLGKPHGRKQGR
jgi:5-methylcytosine-specific restriction endonuclease McrA